jgi:hypothetical protein
VSENQIVVEKLRTLLRTAEPASLGPEPRAGRESLSNLQNQLRGIFSETQFSETQQPLIRSLILLWHDHLDESHSISQNIHSTDGSFLHGIMHRREPDYGNAKYWFHRVGEHPSYPSIARNASEILSGTHLHNLNLIQGDAWDAYAFIDACENALRKNDAAIISVLQQIQEIEFKTLLEHFLR